MECLGGVKRHRQQYLLRLQQLGLLCMNIYEIYMNREKRGTLLAPPIHLSPEDESLIQTHMKSFSQVVEQKNEWIQKGISSCVLPTVLRTNSSVINIVLLSQFFASSTIAHRVFASTNKQAGVHPVFNTEDFSRMFANHPSKDIQRFPTIIGGISQSDFQEPHLRSIEHRGMEVHNEFRERRIAMTLYEIMNKMIGPAQQEATQRISTQNFLLKQGMSPVRLHFVVLKDRKLSIPLDFPELKELVLQYIGAPELRYSAQEMTMSHNFLTPFWVEFGRVEELSKNGNTVYPQEILETMIQTTQNINQQIFEARKNGPVVGFVFPKELLSLYSQLAKLYNQLLPDLEPRNDNSQWEKLISRMKKKFIKFSFFGFEKNKKIQ